MYRFWAVANSREKQLTGFVFSREQSYLGLAYPGSSWKTAGSTGERVQAGVRGRGDLGSGPSCACSSLGDPGMKMRTVTAGARIAVLSPLSSRSFSLSHLLRVTTGCSRHPQLNTPHTKVVIPPPAPTRSSTVLPVSGNGAKPHKWPSPRHNLPKPLQGVLSVVSRGSSSQNLPLFPSVSTSFHASQIHLILCTPTTTSIVYSAITASLAGRSAEIGL